MGDQDEPNSELAGNSKLLRKKKASFMQKTTVPAPPPPVKRFSFNGIPPDEIDTTRKSIKLRNNVQVSNSLTVPSMVIKTKLNFNAVSS